jgi:hypothetical protein
MDGVAGPVQSLGCNYTIKLIYRGEKKMGGAVLERSVVWWEGEPIQISCEQLAHCCAIDFFGAMSAIFDRLLSIDTIVRKYDHVLTVGRQQWQVGSTHGRSHFLENGYYIHIIEILRNKFVKIKPRASCLLGFQ